MAVDERFLTDLLVLDLEAELTPAMEKIGFKKTSFESLHPLEQEILTQSDRAQGTPGQEWRDPQDNLMYENGKGVMIRIRKYENRASSWYKCLLPFNITIRADLKEVSEISPKQAEGLMPSSEVYRRIADHFSEQFGKGIRIVKREHIHPFMRIPDRWTGIPEDAEEPESVPYIVSLIFTMERDGKKGVSYKGGPLKEEEKPQVVKELTEVLKHVANITALYTNREIQVYQAARQADELYGKMIIVPSG